LTCELAIWGDVVLERGLLAFASQRANDLPLSPPSELAARWRLPVWSVKRVMAALRAEKIISDFEPDPGRYKILKPKKFVDGLARRAASRLGHAVAISLPPVLRGRPSEEILAAISSALSVVRAPSREIDVEQRVMALLHSAFVVERPEIAKARAYSGQGPIVLAATAATLRGLEKELNFKRLLSSKRPSSKENRLALPEGFAHAEVLVFVGRSSPSAWTEIGPFAAGRSKDAVYPASPVANALLLSLYPLRGEEASERLLEVLGRLLAERKEKSS
jgi:hypothetical protein